MARLLVLGLLAVIALVCSASVAHAQVSVDIGVNLPGPPSLVIIPHSPVAYAPAVPANLFFYGGDYYAFKGGHWYVSPVYAGPWAIVAPPHIPAPLLAVPVRYYRAPPGHWKHWARAERPHWDDSWGHEWKKLHKDDERAEREASKAREKASRDRSKVKGKAHKEHDKSVKHDKSFKKVAKANGENGKQGGHKGSDKGGGKGKH